MYKPPFSTFSKSAPDPMQPPSARVTPASRPGGSKVFDCPVLKRKTEPQADKTKRIQLVDHRKVRLEGRNIDRRKDIVETPTMEMSMTAAPENLTFEKEIAEAKDHEFWVFPEECKDVFIDRRNGLAYANVCIIGINGRQWPLFPGNNRAPGFVYEALETHRELHKRFKQKIAPPKASGRSVLFSDQRSGIGRTGGQIVSNSDVFNDSMLGRPNVFDASMNSQASNLIRQHRDQEMKNKK